MSNLTPEAYDQIYDVVKQSYNGSSEFLTDVRRAVGSDKYSPDLSKGLFFEADVFKFVFQALNTNKELPLFLDLLASRRVNRKAEIYELMFDIFPDEQSYPDGTFQFFSEKRITAPSIEVHTLAGLEKLKNRNGFGLEKIVDADQIYHNPRKLIFDLYLNQRKVCVVKVNGKSEGTGFLISDDFVLTNHHVVEDAIRHSKPVSCLFDYFELEDGTVNTGIEEAVKEIVASSPPGEQNAQPLSNEWDGNNLDYAVLKLEKKVGGDEVSGLFKKSKRSYINLNKVGAIEKNQPVLILQHPQDKVNQTLHPQKLTIHTNSYLGASPNARRCRYITNTEPGSSGSACFNQHWEIIALHHAGHPDHWPTDQWNQGIPIQTIASQLQDKNILG